MLQPVTTMYPLLGNEYAEWKNVSTDIPLGNPRIGWVQHVSVCSDSGQLRFDQPIITCRPGPVCVVLDSEENLAVLRHFRPVVMPPESAVQYPISDFTSAGVECIEFPRGGAELNETPMECARREVEEEVGFSVVSVEYLDFINGDTAFFPYSCRTCLVRIDRTKRSSLPPDPKEDISIEFLSLLRVLKLVGEGKVVCAQTKSAMLSYLAYLQSNGRLFDLISM